MATEPKLLPGAFALGTDVVCVTVHPSFYLWRVLASGAFHPWIEFQRQHIAADQDRKNQNHIRHSVIPSVCPERRLMLPHCGQCTDRHARAVTPSPPSRQA